MITLSISALFCSEDCIKAHTDLHEPIYDSIHELERLKLDRRFILTVKMFLELQHHLGYIDIQYHVESHEDEKFSLFDFDFSDPNHQNHLKNNLLLLFNMNNFDETATMRELERLLPQPEDPRKRFRKREFVLSDWINGESLQKTNALKRHFKRCQSNSKIQRFSELLLLRIYAALGTSFNLNVLPTDQDNNSIGLFYHPTMLFLAHSCDPNIFIFPGGSKLSLVVNRPVNMCAKLTICYDRAVPYFLDSGTSKCKFHEICMRCTNNSSGSKTMNIEKMLWTAHREIVDLLGGKDEITTADKYFDLLHQLEQCYEFINEHYDNGYEKYPSKRKTISERLIKVAMILEIMLDTPTQLMSLVNIARQTVPNSTDSQCTVVIDPTVDSKPLSQADIFDFDD